MDRVIWNFVSAKLLEIIVCINNEDIHLFVDGEFDDSNRTFIANSGGIDTCSRLTSRNKQELKMIITDRTVNDNLRIVFSNSNTPYYY